MKKVIGLLDSGIGGYTTLDEIKKILPNEDYVYICDTKNNPYGERNDDELYLIIKNNVDILLKRNSKIIVLACNTATTRCIDKLRNDYPKVLFVGTEPAIKVACDNKSKNTLLLATPMTISSRRIHELIKNNKNKDQMIYSVSCEGLANAIENNDNERTNKLLHTYLDNYVYKNIDTIVLGCTHYPHIKNKIQEYFPNAKIIDGNFGVAKRVKYLLVENSLLENNNGNIEIIQNK